MIGSCYTIVSYLEGECCLMPLSILLKTMRKKALLSQKEFAKALAVSVGTINRWENGKTRPNITAMKKLKKFCAEMPFPLRTSKRRGWQIRSNEDGRDKERPGTGRAVPPYL